MPTTRKYTFDVDTKRYLNKVNTYRLLNGLPNIANSDAVDIDNFIIGLKDLELWNNSVMWLLRSGQNVGAGANVISLGGGGIYDGTMLNSPTWGSIGMRFPRTSASCVTATRPIGANPEAEYSIFSVHCNLVEDTLYRTLWLGRDVSNDRMSVRTAGGGSDAFQAGTVGSTAPTSIDGNHSTTLVASSGAVSKAVTTYKDGVFAASATGTNTGTNAIYSIGGLSTDSTRSFGYDISFNAAFKKALSPTMISSLHTLYKATIGRGLGLP